MSKMTLYGTPFSPFARKVRLVLELKGLEVDHVDGLDPVNREKLRILNGRIEVPVLIDDGLVVVNSSDIVAYLDHKYPANPMLPSEARDVQGFLKRCDIFRTRSYFHCVSSPNRHRMNGIS